MNFAKLDKEAFDLVLVRFAIERLMYRLSQSNYRDHFVVKGAIMFQVWSNLSHGPTRDLDLLGTGEPDVGFSEDKQKSVQWNAFCASAISTVTN